MEKLGSIWFTYVSSVAFFLCSSHGSDDDHSDYDSHATSHSDDSHSTGHSDDDSHAADPSVFVLGEFFDYDTFIFLVSIVGGCAIVSLVVPCCDPT